MASVTSKMGLRIWNYLTDKYNHDQQADNFAKIDLHDHTPGRGVQIPTEGLADFAVTDAKVAPGLIPNPANYEYAFSNYRSVAKRQGHGTAQPAGTYLLTTDGTADPLSFQSSTFTFPGVAFYYQPNDWAAGGRATYLRVRAHALTGSTASGVNWTVGLYTVTFSASNASPLIASVAATSGSTPAVFTAPAANSQILVTGADFIAPVAGWYALGVLVSGAAAASSQVLIKADLQTRQV